MNTLLFPLILICVLAILSNLILCRMYSIANNKFGKYSTIYIMISCTVIIIIALLTK